MPDEVRLAAYYDDAASVGISRDRADMILALMSVAGIELRSLPEHPKPPLGPKRAPWSEVETWPWWKRRSPNVRARLRRLNPFGPVEGEMMRGWRPRRRWNAFMEHVVTPKMFIAEYGAAEYRQVPRKYWIMQGRRKAMSHIDFHERPWVSNA